jgi:lysozyme family protein
MAEFNLFLPVVLKFEGGFVDDPADPGGATNKGITLNTFASCSGRLLGQDPTLENLSQLTDEHAGKIYRELYWDKVCGDQIAHQELASIVCDFYVNAGNNATKLLQRVMNDLGCQLPVDGVVGPASLAALSKLDPVEVYRRYKSGRIAYYQRLVANQPALARFLKGWINRVNAFPDL